MNRNEDQEYELLLKQLIRTQLEELKDNKKGNNGSFVFLDSQMLTMFLMYMLMKSDVSINRNPINSRNGFNPTEIIEEIDGMIDQNKQGFEEIYDILKEKLKT